MKILETAIIAEKPEFLDALLSRFPVSREKVLDIDVYRLELSESAVMIIYNLDPNKRYSDEILLHLQPHLRGLIIALNEKDMQIETNHADNIETYLKQYPGTPTILAVATHQSLLAVVNKAVIKNGFYLDNDGRILFWNQENAESLKNIWTTLLQAIQTNQS